jgi:hypothetical protein
MSDERRASERSSLIHNHSKIVLPQMDGYGVEKSPLRNFKYFWSKNSSNVVLNDKLTSHPLVARCSAHKKPSITMGF